MLVEFDDQIFSRQRRGGVSRLFVELAAQFLLRPDLDIEPYFRFALSRNEYLAELPGHRVRHVADGSMLDHRRICGAINGLRATLRFEKPQGVLHLTYYNRKYLKEARGRPIVSTVYDLIPELHPQLSMNQSAHEDKMAVVRSSDLIICISETVRAELIAVVGTLGAEVHAIPLGAHRLGEEAALGNSRRRDDQILFVGMRSGYKCFRVLLDALTHLPDLPIEVLCVGGGAFTTDELAVISKLPPGVALIQRDLSDADLRTAYSEATLFVSTSIAEGFGLPAVEAMAAGCPVVLSDIEIFRETAGPDLATVPIHDAESLAAILAALLKDRRARSDVARRGWERAAAFSWASTAEKTAAAYHALA